MKRELVEKRLGEILQATLRHYDPVTLEEIMSRRRRPDVDAARNVAIWIASNHAYVGRAGLRDLGQLFGGRTHAAIACARKAVETRPALLRDAVEICRGLPKPRGARAILN